MTFCSSRLGFAGIGTMGLPMARRLVAAGHPLTVWNRSPQPLSEAQAFGANSASSFVALVEQADVIFCAFANGSVLDAVLRRHGNTLGIDIADKTFIQLGTTSIEHSEQLARAIAQTGGHYIEAPVSGSRGPAKEGRLVAMLGAATESDFLLAEGLLPAFAETMFRCGAPPAAMKTKLSVNCFLITMVLGLAEAWNLAETLGVDHAVFRAILDAGPMSSAVSRGKLAKLAAQEWTAQASIGDVLMNAELVTEAAQMSGLSADLALECRAWLDRAVQAGLAREDMIAVTRAAHFVEPDNRDI